LRQGLIYLDYDCIEETIEETEGSRILGEIMKEKLRYAIFNCDAIDGDAILTG
jgi:hypothetical protein